MTPERWQRIKAIFDEVDPHPPNERSAIIGQLCGGDDELRHQIEQMFEELDDGFIENAIVEESASLSALTDAATAPPEGFGHYKIIRRIGQGGMGAVYEATRVDDFRKKVAIKVIKHEFDSDVARTRFQQERQLLAVLEHPYIARLIDGGESESGSPYLVLEFVDGVPISEYCAKLDRKACLRLFLKVCDAVDYAHRNLIIHRDLKPGNILVTENGEPKLLDFGIAKLMDPSATLTQTSMIALTPEYASPEQVRGERISTASDVYSLGVILYQILTGRKPYTLDSVTPFELDRVICQQPPAPPALGDELDHILLMALRKEPERRYRSVREFAEDVERYLTLRPVLARPDTTWYRTRKYVRRQWIPLAWAAFAVAALLTGTVLAIRASWRADAEAAVAREINEFLKRDLLLQATGFQQPDPNITVKTALDRAAARIGNRFAGQPRTEASLRQTIAEAYEQLALYPEAKLHIEKAVELLEKNSRRDDYQKLVAISALASIDWRQGNLKDADRRLADVIPRMRRTLGPDHVDTLEAAERLVAVDNLLGRVPEAIALIRTVIESRIRTTGPESPETLLAQGNLAATLYTQGSYAEAAKAGSQTLAAMTRVMRLEDPVRLSSATNLAFAYMALGRYGEAEAILRQIIEIRSRSQGAENPDTLISRNGLVLAHLMSGKFAEAETESLKVVEATRRLLGPQHQDTLAAIRNLGACYQLEGKTQLAITTSEGALEVYQRVFGLQHPRAIATMGWLGSAYAVAGRYRESEALLRKAIDLATSRFGPKHPDTLLLANRLATTYRMEGKLTQAEALLNDVADGLRANLGPEHPNTLLTAGNLAFVALALDNAKRAEDTVKPALAIYDEKQPDHWGRYRCQAVLGASLAAQGKSGEAEALLLSGYQGLVERRATIPSDSRFMIAKAGEWILDLYRSTRRPDKAAEWAARLRKLQTP